MPPTMPVPSHIIQIWCRYTPIAENTRPPHQQHAATNPALRGPARSSQPPHTAAAAPRKTKYSVYIQPSSLIFQSQLVETMRARKDMSGAQAIVDEPFTARDSGSQNTLKPYAIPIHRWIANAAGGTSHRLNPGPAMVRSLSSNPMPFPPPTSTPAASAISASSKKGIDSFL